MLTSKHLERSVLKIFGDEARTEVKPSTVFLVAYKKMWWAEFS
jgi:hypothetical protein